MNCNHKVSSMCEGCSLAKSNNKRSFAISRTELGDEIHLSSDDGHLLFILDGEIEVDDGKTRYTCKTNEIVLLPIKTSYRVAALAKTKILVFKFSTHYQVCNDVNFEKLGDLVNKMEYRFNTLEINMYMSRFLESVMFYLEHRVCCDYLHEAKAIELFIVYKFFYSPEEIIRFFYPILRKDVVFSTLVYNNYEKARTVKDLAELCGYSLSNFKKIFTKKLGVSPYQWMQKQKMYKIKSRLLDKSIPIKSIAMEFGFADPAHLNSYCKRYFNATPQQIRNSSQE